jgi:hypothetical protein
LRGHPRLEPRPAVDGRQLDCVVEVDDPRARAERDTARTLEFDQLELHRAGAAVVAEERRAESHGPSLVFSTEDAPGSQRGSLRASER